MVTSGSRLAAAIFAVMVSVSSYGSVDGSCQYKRITGTYSDFFFHSESGDVLGVEVSLVFGEGQYFVVFQYAEGVPSRPFIAPATVKDGQISFSLPPQSSYKHFSGKITPCFITGSFTNGQVGPKGEKELLLLKKPSYWHK